MLLYFYFFLLNHLPKLLSCVAYATPENKTKHEVIIEHRAKLIADGVIDATNVALSNATLIPQLANVSSWSSDNIDMFSHYPININHGTSLPFDKIMCVSHWTLSDFDDRYCTWWYDKHLNITRNFLLVNVNLMNHMYILSGCWISSNRIRTPYCDW